jgi:hypothetical protein
MAPTKVRRGPGRPPVAEKKAYVATTVSKKLETQLKREAKRRGVSVANLIRNFLEEYMEKTA